MSDMLKRLSAEDVSQRQGAGADAKAADLEEAAPRDTVAEAVALTEDRQHVRSPR